MIDQTSATPAPSEQISLHQVTAETVRQVCELSDTLQPSLNRMVASKAISIAQA